jgi:hypothetical protein
MSQFYSSDQTELSRVVLGDVLEMVPQAILIGGWGTWVRTGGPMSHDIDLILSRYELDRLGALIGDLSVSRHLAGTKWRGTWKGIHLDLYVAYSSRLGANLQLKVEELEEYAERVGSYRVLSIAAHTATKIAALLDRPDSMPGRKDRQEILKLLEDPCSSETPGVVARASSREHSEVAVLLGRAFELLVGEPALGQRDRTRLRRTAAGWQQALDRAFELRKSRESTRSVGDDLGS